MPVLPSYRNQLIDLLWKSIDRFLYEGNIIGLTLEIHDLTWAYIKYSFKGRSSYVPSIKIVYPRKNSKHLRVQSQQ